MLLHVNTVHIAYLLVFAWCLPYRVLNYPYGLDTTHSTFTIRWPNSQGTTHQNNLSAPTSGTVVCCLLGCRTNPIYSLLFFPCWFTAGALASLSYPRKRPYRTLSVVCGHRLHHQYTTSEPMLAYSATNQRKKECRRSFWLKISGTAI